MEHTNGKELLEKVTSNRAAHECALRGMIAPAKAAVNILKDSGHRTSASELEAQIFLVESIQRDLCELIRASSADVIMMAFEQATKPPMD